MNQDPERQPMPLASSKITPEDAAQALAKALASPEIQETEANRNVNWTKEEYAPDEAMNMLMTMLSSVENTGRPVSDGRTKALHISPGANRSFQSCVSDCVTAIKGALDDGSADDDYKAMALNYALPGANSILEQLKDREAFQERRLDHALKILKKKGMFSTDMVHLEDIVPDETLQALLVAHCNIGTRLLSVGNTGSLDEGSWKIGIDLAMAVTEPQLGLSDSLYGAKLAEHLPLICACTVLAAYGSKLARLTSSSEFMEALTEPILNMAMKSDIATEAIANLTDDVSKKLVAQKEAEWKRTENSLKSQISALEAANESLSGEYAKILDRNLEQELTDAKARAKELEDAARGLQADVNSLKDALEERDRNLSALSEKLGNAAIGNIVLPENAMFFGGHVNMLKKVVASHPSWTFIDGTDENFNAPINAPDVLFIWDKHISHPTWWRIRNLLYGRTPVVYVKSTNTDMMEIEMKKGWLAARKESEDE